MTNYIPMTQHPAVDRVMRVLIFRPYLAGKGPFFRLIIWDTKRTDSRGQTYVGYRLEQRQHATKPIVVFEGEDYSPSSSESIDGDDSVRGLMSFLTLRPGDTDWSYFENYTNAQMQFCEEYAEALACEIINRFGEDV